MSLVFQGNDILKDWEEKWKEVYKINDSNNKEVEKEERKYFGKNNFIKKGKHFGLNDDKPKNNIQPNNQKTENKEERVNEEQNKNVNLINFDFGQNSNETQKEMVQKKKEKGGFSFIKRKGVSNNQPSNNPIENTNLSNSPNVNNIKNKEKIQSGFCFIKKNKVNIPITPQPIHSQLEDIFNSNTPPVINIENNKLSNCNFDIQVVEPQNSLNTQKTDSKVLLDLHEEERQKEEKIKNLNENLFKAYNESKEEPKIEKNNEYDGILNLGIETKNPPQSNIGGFYNYNNMNNFMNYDFNRYNNIGYCMPNSYINFELYNNPNKKKNNEENQKANIVYNTNAYNNKDSKKEIDDPFNSLVTFK